VGYFKTLLSTVRKTFDFHGRSNLSEYWGASIAGVIISLAGGMVYTGLAGYAGVNTDMLGAVFKIFNFVIFVPFLALGVRRLHDINRSGWWLLISFTVVGAIPLIYWTLKKSDAEANKYGPVPQGAEGGGRQRIIGISLVVIVFILTLFNAYSTYDELQNWNLAEINNGGAKLKTINRLLQAKGDRGAIIKLVIICDANMEMAVAVSSISVKDDREIPAAIIEPENFMPIFSAGEGVRAPGDNGFKFSVLDDEKNIALADAQGADILRLFKDNFYISLKTRAGVWSAGVGGGDPKVLDFIKGCSK